MRIQFLGTGAAEGNPPVFDRLAGDRLPADPRDPNVRTRSSLRLGTTHQIDFGPDHFAQSLRCGFDSYDLEHVIVTHTHADHLHLNGVLAKELARKRRSPGIRLYAGPQAAAWIDSLFEFLQKPGTPVDEYERLRAAYPVTRMEFFTEHDVGGLTVRTVRGNHRVSASGESSMNPLITLPDGRTLLYAVDTDYYDDESFDYLSGTRLDLLVMECTFGGLTEPGAHGPGHLNAATFLRMLDRMGRDGVVHSGTRVYATHINPVQPLDHDGLGKYFADAGYAVTVAYDCLALDGDG